MNSFIAKHKSNASHIIFYRSNASVRVSDAVTAGVIDESIRSFKLARYACRVSRRPKTPFDVFLGHAFYPQLVVMGEISVNNEKENGVYTCVAKVPDFKNIHAFTYTFFKHDPTNLSRFIDVTEYDEYVIRMLHVEIRHYRRLTRQSMKTARKAPRKTGARSVLQ